MNGLEKITRRIQEDSQLEVERIRSDAQDRADEVQREARNRAQQESAAILARGKRSAEERLERLSSAAAMEAKKLELAAKQEMLDEAFRRALDQLCALPREEQVTLLTRLALEASTTGEEELIFSAADREKLGAPVVAAANGALDQAGELPGRLTLSPNTRPIRGGFILADGDVEVNCAYETLVRMQRESMEKQVAEALFV